MRLSLAAMHRRIPDTGSELREGGSRAPAYCRRLSDTSRNFRGGASGAMTSPVWIHSPLALTCTVWLIRVSPNLYSQVSSVPVWPSFNSVSTYCPSFHARNR